ncbi:hypothetical protein RCL_jg15781.t1 [Rhizophagus clarus]|uniref:Uncharacterized protein n=1 Tax=Rhizophagus clarus TaxID=94130 RepID=A0A8H3MD82_9GLOM|nr:hypothetical protein RCL_jg15781.t1 [Rhizophagus clarus]
MGIRLASFSKPNNFKNLVHKGYFFTFYCVQNVGVYQVIIVIDITSVINPDTLEFTRKQGCRFLEYKTNRTCTIKVRFYTLGE